VYYPTVVEKLFSNFLYIIFPDYHSAFRMVMNLRIFNSLLYARALKGAR